MSLSDTIAKLEQARVNLALLTSRIQDATAELDVVYDVLGDIEHELETPEPEEHHLHLERASLWYTPDLPPDVGQYEWLTLQRSSDTANRFSQSSATADRLIYASPVARRASDNSGWTQCLRPGAVSDAWLYRNAAGKTITRGPANDLTFFVNPGNASFIQAVLQWLPGQLAASGAKAVMIDEVNEDPKYAFGPAASSITKAQHQADLLKFLRALDGAGISTYINLGANLWPVSDWVNDLVDTVDGIWLEQFVGRSLSGYPTPAVLGDMWAEQMQFVQWAEDRRNVAVNVAHSDQAVIDYAFMSWLTATNDFYSFGVQPGGNGLNLSVSPALWAKAEKLGEPVSTPDLTVSPVVRQFEGGSVTVRPTLTEWRTGGHIDLTD